jgi:hypothetical protein
MMFIKAIHVIRLQEMVAAPTGHDVGLFHRERWATCFDPGALPGGDEVILVNLLILILLANFSGRRPLLPDPQPAR